MDEVDKACDELTLYKAAGGGTICEMSVVGIRRLNHSLTDLCNLSLSTKIHVVAATGFYCQHFLPDWAKEMSVREMADFMSRELVVGAGEDGIRCGLMYIGCSDPLQETELRALEAAALTQKETGVLILCLFGSCYD